MNGMHAAAIFQPWMKDVYNTMTTTKNTIAHFPPLHLYDSPHPVSYSNRNAVPLSYLLHKHSHYNVLFFDFD